ncbi:bifunctional diguanylate cyclase/phosphodiesterase [Chitinimonas lacunae]|uniref:EAL domain-containing protein n=1 Tax=Chitinimonas lacunae TaxID=1963018 RepID=A0ABV8MQH4_9NEIS
MTARRNHDVLLQQQLASTRDYLEALDAASTLLIDPGHDPLARVLEALARACKATVAALYRNRPNELKARRVALWHHPDTPMPSEVVAELSQIDYGHYRPLRDTLVAGLMLIRRISELLPTAQILLSRFSAQHVLCVPLLDGGELIGFIAMLMPESPRQRTPLDARLLSTLANYLSLSLAKQETVSRLRANETRLKALVGATEDMVFELDGDGLLVNVWSHHSALPSTDLTGLPLEKAFPQDMAWCFRQALDRVVKSGRSEQVEFIVPKLDGSIYFIGRLEPVPSEDGSRRHVVALVRDATELMREEAQRRAMEETLNLLEEAVVDLSPDGRLLNATPAWTKLCGLARSQLGSELGRSLFDRVHEEEKIEVAASLARVAADGQPSSLRFRLLREDSDPLWLEARLIAHRGIDGQVASLRGVLHDVTEMHLNERHIRKLALYDGLTGLPNRMLLDDLLHQAISRARRNNTKVGLGFIDLDHFKQINDAFGHHAGDKTLVIIAKQLKSVLREEDVLARWGGDEFVVLLPDLPDQSALVSIAERLREIARQGVLLDGIETRPTISIGIAVFPDNAENGDELMSAADSTMYHAKSAGRNNVQFYSDIMHLKTLGREHMAIQTRLNNVVLDNELQVFYQPLVHARTGEVSSVEALVRWHDDKTGWVSPQVFIPMAERLGLIQELSEQVMVQALTKLKGWRQRGLSQRLAINVSRNQLFSPKLIHNLLGLLRQFELRPDDIVIEITESLALTDYSRQSRHLKEFHNAGFKIAIDDFGTGYSSLSQLHDMPIDILKVDISFTARLNTEAGRRIMHAIVQMGQALGLEVVVEGVETLESARFLQGLGVEKMQGFYFSDAVPAGVCELMMQLGMQAKI